MVLAHEATIDARPAYLLIRGVTEQGCCILPRVTLYSSQAQRRYELVCRATAVLLQSQWTQGCVTVDCAVPAAEG